MSPPPRRSRRPRWLRIADVVDLGSFRRQLVLSTAALSALVAVGLVLSVQVALAGSAVDSVDRLLDDRADVLVGSIDAATTSTSLVVPAAVVDPGVAVFDGQGELVSGYVPPHQAREFARLSRTTTTRSQTLGDAFALVGQPFTTRTGAHGVVVLSERLAPFEDDEQDALVVSIVAGAVLVLVATTLAAWASRRALAPVARMASTAEGWSEHELDRRFDLGPPTNEIRALGQTLDGLLGKVERTIRAEQRLTSELAHELRTPLTAVQGTAELVAMRDDLDPELREDVEEILRSSRAMAGTVSSLLDLARSQSSAHAEESADLEAVVRSVVLGLDAEKVEVRIAARRQVAMPGGLLARAVAPVIENATRFADHVQVGSHDAGRFVVLTVSDDGPGVPPADAERIFRAGQTSQTGTGSGLGLALARRIARTAGGDVTLLAAGSSGTRSVRAGATFEIRLPTRPA